jgi:hydrogenase small subunit
MQISRRTFVKYASASAAALGLSGVQLRRAEEVIAASTTPPVIWLSGSGCTGCSISLMNAVNPTIDEILTTAISLRYHPNLMAAAGDLAVSSALSTAQAGGHILVVEGAIPTGASSGYCYVWDEGGRSVTMADAVSAMAATASQVIAVGACAAFGGIPAANPSAHITGLSSFLGRSVIAIPGCPANPGWVVGAIVQLLAGTPPALDSYGRPSAWFGRTIHSQCPRREREEANTFGQSGLCLKEIGCKGPETRADCPTRLWNGGRSWCVAVNGPCIGCTEPNFPRFPLHLHPVEYRGTTPSPVPSVTPVPSPIVTPSPSPTPGPQPRHRLVLPLVPADGTSSGGI